MAQRNPVPARVRGHILVTAIVTSSSTATILLAEAAAGLPSPWIAVTGSALAAVSTVATTLSRANLTLDDGDESRR